MRTRRFSLDASFPDIAQALWELRADCLNAHVHDGDMDELDDELADALIALSTHDERILFAVIRDVVEHHKSDRYPNREAMKRHIIGEFRADYRGEWTHEPDTAFDNLCACMELMMQLDGFRTTLSIDGVVRSINNLFLRVVPEMRDARATDGDYSI